MTINITTSKVGLEDLNQSAAGGTYNRTRTVAGVAGTTAINNINADNFPVLAQATQDAFTAKSMAAEYVGDAIDALLTRVTSHIFNVKDYGATGDGATDDSTAIQSTIDAASTAGGGIVFIPAGTYLLETVQGIHSVLLRPKSGVTIMGVGDTSVLKAGAGLNGLGTTFSVVRHVSDDPSPTLDNARFYNFKVDCNGQNNTVPAAEVNKDNVAIGARAGQNLVVEGVTVVNNSGRQCFSFGSNANPHSVQNLRIERCLVVNVGTAVTGNANQTDHSVIYAQADGAVIRGNIFRNDTQATEATAIECHSSNAVVEGNVIDNFGTAFNVVATVTDQKRTTYRGNTVKSTRLLFNFWTEPTFTMEQILIEGNVLEANAEVNAVNMYTNTNATVLDVAFIGNKFKSVVAVSAVAANCITIGDVAKLKVHGNTFQGFLGRAVALDTIAADTLELEITDNTIIDCGKTTSSGSRQAIALNQGAGTAIKRLVIVGNRIDWVDETPAIYGISFNADLTRAVIKDNLIEGAVTQDIYTASTTITRLDLDHEGDVLPAYKIKASEGSRWVERSTGRVYRKHTDASDNIGWAGESYGSAQPSTGIHYDGHIHWNTDNTDGAPVAWICTVAGNPGTWRRLARLPRVQAIGGATTLDDTADVVLVSGGAAYTVTLPAAPFVGQRVTVKDNAGNAAAFPKTVAGNGAQTIDGAASITLNINYESATLVSDGANWFRIG